MNLQQRGATHQLNRVRYPMEAAVLIHPLIPKEEYPHGSDGEGNSIIINAIMGGKTIMTMIATPKYAAVTAINKTLFSKLVTCS